MFEPRHFIVEIDMRVRQKVYISAPSEERANEIVYDRIENEEIDLLDDAEIRNWEINSIEEE